MDSKTAQRAKIELEWVMDLVLPLRRIVDRKAGKRIIVEFGDVPAHLFGYRRGWICGRMFVHQIPELACNFYMVI